MLNIIFFHDFKPWSVSDRKMGIGHTFNVQNHKNGGGSTVVLIARTQAFVRNILVIREKGFKLNCRCTEVILPCTVHTVPIYDVRMSLDVCASAWLMSKLTYRCTCLLAVDT